MVPNCRHISSALNNLLLSNWASFFTFIRRWSLWLVLWTCPGLSLGTDTKCRDWYSSFTPVAPPRFLASALRHVKTALFLVVPNSLIIRTVTGSSKFWVMSPYRSISLPSHRGTAKNNVHITRSHWLRKGSRVRKFDREAFLTPPGTATLLTFRNKHRQTTTK